MRLPDDDPNASFTRLALIAACAGAIAGVLLAALIGMAGCTPAQREAAGNHAALAAEFAACAQGVVAKEEQRKAREALEAERLAAEEAEAIADAAREHSPDTKSELDKYMRVRDGGTAQ